MAPRTPAVIAYLPAPAPAPAPAAGAPTSAAAPAFASPFFAWAALKATTGAKNGWDIASLGVGRSWWSYLQQQQQSAVVA